MMRVLILSPGHPELGGGGSERAAYSLFERLRADREIEAAFVAHAGRNVIGGVPLYTHRSRADELIASPPPVDGFSLQTSHLDRLSEMVMSLVKWFNPDVVHVHHVLNFGIEVLKLFADLRVKVVLTLHDFVPICAHYGQMVKANLELCHVASDADCAACIPRATAGHFFLRRAIIKEMLGHADAFVSPTDFLAERFLVWGLPLDRPIVVIDNLLNPELIAEVDRRRNAKRGVGTVDLGFFGQVTPFKGLDVLLEAMARLPDPQRGRIRLHIYGENIHYRAGSFGRKLSRLLKATRDAVTYGSYSNGAVVTLMQKCDFVVVPSIWWENSPLVIQEARVAGRRIVASNIGGMRERTDNKFDILVPPGDADALACVLAEIADGKVKPSFRRARELAKARVAAESALYEGHLALFRSLIVH